MNSRQRVITALNRREPDRVPILEWVIHPKAMIEATQKYGRYPITI